MMTMTVLVAVFGRIVIVTIISILAVIATGTRITTMLVQGSRGFFFDHEAAA